MTVGTSSLDARGYAEFESTGVLDSDSFTIGGVPHGVFALAVGPVPNLKLEGLNFDLKEILANSADYTLEFAGETLPLAQADSSGGIDRKFNFPETWLAANAPLLSAANFETTLPLGAMVPVCLRTAAQVCPGGTTTNAVPVFGEGPSAVREVAENTVEGTDIGSPLTATDAENDSLEYTLEGADAASFDIVLGTGQLQTKDGRGLQPRGEVELFGDGEGRRRQRRHGHHRGDGERHRRGREVEEADHADGDGDVGHDGQPGL